MPKFDFNLEAVLTVRKNAERERQRALGVLLAQMSEMEAELRRLDEEVKVAGQELRGGKLTGQVDLAYLAGHRRYVLAMERNARAVIQRMGLLNRQIEEARALLVEAARARKVVEKLRERKFEAWRADLLKKEQAEIDEVGSTLTVLAWQKEAREGNGR